MALASTLTPAEARAWGRGVTARPRHWPPAVLGLVRERWRHDTCVICQSAGLVPPPGEPLDVDHLQPVSKGGDNHFSNLRLLCRSHNRGRGNRKHAPARPKWARTRR